MFCEYEYDEGTKKGRDSGKDEHGIYSGKINQCPAKEGTDHTAKSIGHGKICLSFDGIFGFHDRIYIVDRGGSHKSPSKHLKNLYSIIDGDSRCQKRSKRFQHEENTGNTNQNITADFFDDIAKKEQGRKLTHSRNCRCSSHLRTSATFALCNLKVKIIQKYVAEINKNVSVGVSVHGSVLDLEVDTGEFPVGELKALLRSLHQKKRYHRLRDGRLLRLDDSMEVLDELNETLELSGAKLGQTHARLPLYRAPSLDWALSGQNGIRFNRDDAFRQLSRSFHAVKDSEYTPPASLQKVLRKYQRDGYRWLRTLDGYGMGGILADDMGLGKTVQVLSYLLALREQGGNPLPSLIVCPASLVLNWAEECRKFTPELNCVVVDGDAAHRAQLAEQWDGADVVVTSYDLLRRDETLYESQKFYACILDEAQAIKNHTTQKYKAVCGVNSRVRFALTGTPVENRLGELWSIFSFLMPGYLPPYKSFCSRFEKPITQENDPAAVRRLNQLTGPFILRRMKSEVLKELPPKTENVYRIELEEEQRKLYLAAVVDAREKLRAAKPEDKMAVFAVLMRLREICCDPRLIADNWTGGSAKLDACIELVTSAVEGGHRILLFSQFTSMLELLAKRLDAEGVSHFTLQGSTPKPVRAELVRRFNGGEASVFLISLRAGGTGLNLTAADIVIHYDPWWNVAAQNQATDRAYRIGQQNPVQVYKLIAQDTIEEKIVELQQAKQDLAETVTGSADGAILRMKPEELLNLLEGTE